MNVCMSYKYATNETIDISKGVDIIKSNKSKQFMIYHYWYFKGIGYKF